MKCLYVKSRPFDDSFIGGVRTHMVGMVNGFYDAGVDTYVLTEAVLSDVRAVQECRLIAPANCIGTDRRYDKHIKRCLLNYVNENKDLDFMYNRMDSTFLSTMHVSQKTGIPYVLEYNSSKIVGWKEVRLPQIMENGNVVKKTVAKLISPFRCRSIDKREMVLLNNAALVITVSDVLCDELMQRGIPKEKILVCPNGVDPSVFKFDADAGKSVRTKIGIPQDEIVVGFSGTFGKWHGIPELTETIKKLHAEKKMSYLLMGDGIMKSQMEKELEEYDDVHFLGKVPFPKMPAYLSACDILLVTNSWNPSDKRPFFGSPTKMFEYMAMGKAIVASNLEQIGHILRDSENCIGFMPGDIDGMKNAIIRAAADSVLRQNVGEKAREDVVASYTWKHNAERIISIIRKG